MVLNWIKCSGEQWCSLLNLNLSDAHFEGLQGVYIIWHGAPNPAVVRIGQGIIRDRLSSHRTDSEVLAYSQNGLYVTWAKVLPIYMDGVEKYLADRWNPKIGGRFPDVAPIEVNSPW